MCRWTKLTLERKRPYKNPCAARAGSSLVMGVTLCAPLGRWSHQSRRCLRIERRAAFERRPRHRATRAAHSQARRRRPPIHSLPCYARPPSARATHPLPARAPEIQGRGGVREKFGLAARRLGAPLSPQTKQVIMPTRGSRLRICKFCGAPCSRARRRAARARPALRPGLLVHDAVLETPGGPPAGAPATQRCRALSACSATDPRARSVDPTSPATWPSSPATLVHPVRSASASKPPL